MDFPWLTLLKKEKEKPKKKTLRKREGKKQNKKMGTIKRALALLGL